VNPDLKRSAAGGWTVRPENAGGRDISVTESEAAGHSGGMNASRMQPLTAVAADEPAQAVAQPQLDLAAVYEAQFDFVWRSARRLGVSTLHLDDVVQEVFLVVHRRLGEFEGRSTLKSWLFGITRRVVRDNRRSAQRKPTASLRREPLDEHGRAADRLLELREQAQLLHELLAELDFDKREVFVLAELEQMSGPEIAAALQINLNTVYARVRAARQAFEAALARHALRSARRAP